MLVVTQPARPVGRGRKPQPTPVALAAHELGIAHLTPERLRDAYEPLREADADLFAVASYGKILPPAILALPRLGALNVHPSLLPLYRGATPLQSQLRDGVTESGATIIAMDAGMDTGDIVLQEHSAIGPCETYGELHERFARVGAELLTVACARADGGTLTRTPQAGRASEAEIARTLTHPLTKDDLRLFPRDASPQDSSAAALANRARSLAPTPGARLDVPGTGTVKVLEAHMLAGPGPMVASAPGDVLLTRGGPLLRAADGWVIIDRLVPPGRKAMTRAEFASGWTGPQQPRDVEAELRRWWEAQGRTAVAARHCP